MSAVATQDGRAAERDRTADQLAVLSGEVAVRDAALATLLSRLAVAIRQDNREEVQGYAGAIDPHAVAELLVFTSGLKQACELALRRKDGSFFTVALEGIVSKGGEHHQQRCLVALLDITERKRAQAELVACYL